MTVEPLNRTPSPGEYQTPDQTLAKMQLPDGFRVQVFAAEPDVVQPIGYAPDHYDATTYQEYGAGAFLAAGSQVLQLK